MGFFEWNSFENVTIECMTCNKWIELAHWSNQEQIRCYHRKTKWMDVEKLLVKKVRTKLSNQKLDAIKMYFSYVVVAVAIL